MAEIFRFGSWATEDVTKIIHLWSLNSTAKYSVMRRENAGGVWPPVTTAGGGAGQGYKVTAGKTLYITAVFPPPRGNAGTRLSVFFLYADNAAGFNVVVGTLTNPKTIIGHTGAFPGIFGTPEGNGGHQNSKSVEMPTLFTIPGEKYLVAYVDNNPGMVHVVGFEA